MTPPERYQAVTTAPERIDLEAGPLSMVFEPATTFLRYVRLGARDVLRGIYVAVRDEHWSTIPAHLANLSAERTEGGFRLSFDVEVRERHIDFFWKGVITGQADGTVRFEMDGQARSTFLRNRIGFCVLHPAACAGLSCVVEHTDGRHTRGTFPEFIAPHQPFEDIRAITHPIAPGVTAEVRFEGDVFEMEDQRNWTDASFKTYGTPLARPMPVEVRSGDTVRQVVTLSLKGDVPSSVKRPATAPEVVLTVDETTPVPLPAIGVGAATHDESLSERAARRLQALGLAHLRVDLWLDDPAFPERLARASEEAYQVGAGLEAALFVNDDAGDGLARLRAALDRIRPRIASWLVFHTREKSTTARWVQLAREHLGTYAPEAPFGAGSNTFFTELNRARPPLGHVDRICFPATPQVHAFDEASMVETFEGEAATVRSARHFAPGVPVAVTPITLHPRFDADPREVPRVSLPGRLPFGVDARQATLFAAAWTLGSLAAHTVSGASSLTFYETTGWRGVMETEAGAPEPDLFPSVPGGVFPLYHVLADAAPFAGGEVRPVASSEPLRAVGLMLVKDGRHRLLCANVTAEPQQVGVALPEGVEVRVHYLDETNVYRAVREPEAFRQAHRHPVQVEAAGLRLQLRPYAYVRIDSISSIS